jgi:hypothetical protein
MTQHIYQMPHTIAFLKTSIKNGKTEMYRNYKSSIIKMCARKIVIFKQNISQKVLSIPILIILHCFCVDAFVVLSSFQSILSFVGI